MQVNPAFDEDSLGLAMIAIQGVVYAAGAAVLLMNLKEGLEKIKREREEQVGDV